MRSLYIFLCARVPIVLAAYAFACSIVLSVCPLSWLDQGDLAPQLIWHLLIQFMIVKDNPMMYPTIRPVYLACIYYAAQLAPFLDLAGWSRTLTNPFCPCRLSISMILSLPVFFYKLLIDHGIEPHVSQSGSYLVSSILAAMQLVADYSVSH